MAELILISNDTVADADQVMANFHELETRIEDGTGSSFTWLGAWNGATAYAKDDAVSSGGSSWLALRPNTGVAPVDGADWGMLAQKGSTGVDGAPGANGADGLPGADGVNGPPGAAGANGADGGIISTLARANATATTGVLAAGATENLTIALGRISLLIRVSTSHAARVRLYRAVAQRTADAAREIGTRPVGNHGLIFEGVTTVGTLSIDVLRELLAVNAVTLSPNLCQLEVECFR